MFYIGKLINILFYLQVYTHQYIYSVLSYLVTPISQKKFVNHYLIKFQFILRVKKKFLFKVKSGLETNIDCFWF